jgi:hypothetical protein
MKTDLRVEVRNSDDGLTQAALQLPEAKWMMLCTVPTMAYEGSQEVRDAFVVLAKAVVSQAVREALDDDALSLGQSRTH